MRVTAAILLPFILVGLALFQPGCSSLPRYPRTGSRPADTVIANTEVFTADEKNPRAEAVAIADGRIVYVGDADGAADFVGPDTRVIDARGRFLTPGFVDNHCHILWIGALLSLMTKDLFACSNLEEVKAVVLKQARDNPTLPFVSGVGWKYDYIPGGLPDKAMLDAVIADRPVMLMSLDGQTGWANSRAVKLMEEKNPSAFRELVPSRDEKTGEYTGIFRHFHRFSPLDYFTPEELGADARERMLKAMDASLREAVSSGVTTLNDVQIYREFVPMVLEFRDRGGLKDARARCSLYIGPHSLQNEERFKQDLAWWKEIGKKESDPHLILGDSLKFYIDGCVGNHTSFFLEPYRDDPGNFGEPVWSQEDFNRVIALVDGLGLQACTHAIGDAGIRRVIDACENAEKINGRRDSRHRLEHCEFPEASDRERMARLGIYAAMHPTHFYGDETFEKTVGSERLQRFMPWRSLEKAGVNLSFGSDWCNSPFNPIYGLLVSSLRLNYHHNDDWGPVEGISLEDGIRYWTIGSARALFLDREIGSIEVGKRADLVLFDTDLTAIDSWWFLFTHNLELGKLDGFVLMTMVDGRMVYQKPGEDL